MNKLFYRLFLGIFLSVVAAPIVGPCLAEDKSVSGGLIAHWNFLEDSGDVIKDSSGNGNDGTIVPTNTSQPKWGVGSFAGSVSFSGGNDHFVRIPASPSLNGLKKKISVVALIYPRHLWTPIDRYISFAQRKWKQVAQSAKRMVGMATNSETAHISSSTGFIAIVQRQWRETIHPDQYYLGYGPENNVLHYKWHLGLIGDDVSLYRLPKGQQKPQSGEWVHLVGTYDGDTGKMSLYVNGELIGTQTHVGEIRLDRESLNRPVAIGAELNGPSIDEPTAEFDGYIRDIRIYDRALSDEEVTNLAQAAKTQMKK
jgi:hypothetical protein